MSELKVKHVVDVYDAYSANPYNEAQVYLQSEADKVIADLEESHKMEVEQLLMEIVELKETLNNSRNARKYWRKEYLIEYKESLHQKYKRCLAMAEWCDAEADVADADGDYEDMQWYQKWHKRWLAIAEKFKTNSTAQQGKEEEL